MMYYFWASNLHTVHEHFSEYVGAFNYAMNFKLLMPAILLIVSSFALLRFAKNLFPTGIIWASIVLVVISVATTFFVVLPALHDFASKGFDAGTLDSLKKTSMLFQIIPAGLACLPALGLMNIYFEDTKPFARWVFILFFSTAFYSVGTDAIEAGNYPLWKIVGEHDWLVYRKESGVQFSTFILIYLLPGFLSILWILIMLRWRPKGIHIGWVLLHLAAWIWIAFTTATYFVPKVQIPLDSAYSEQLITNIIKYNPIRKIPGLLSNAIAAWMFLKVKTPNFLKNNL